MHNEFSKILKLLIVTGTFVVLAIIFTSKRWAFISCSIAAMVCGIVFLRFENKRVKAGYAVMLSAFTALSVAGRFIFAFIPGFKPVTAIVIIAGFTMGGYGGFLCGALSAVISNFFFGQGPWTLFQMLAWGVIGAGAGALKQYRYRTVFVCIYGAIAGVLYSVIMDIWSVIWYMDTFTLKAFVTAFIASGPYLVIYCVSNVIFLLILNESICRKTDRIVKKYRLNNV